MKTFHVSGFKFQVLAVVLAAGAAVAGPMDTEKLYELPERSEQVDPRVQPLMRDALGADDQLTRLKALHEIRRYAFTELGDAVAKLLDDPEPMVVTSALQTLDTLDAKSAASKLVRFIKPQDSYGPAARDQMVIADRVLARWQHAEAVEPWINRLGSDVLLSLRISAARALASADASAVDPLTERVADPGMPIALRQTAAGSLGVLFAEHDNAGVRALVTKLAGSTNPSDQLMAVRIVESARSDFAIEKLRALAGASEPAVQHAAMSALFDHDPKLLWENAAQTITSYDPKVRLVTVRAIESQHQPVSVELLTGALNDPHPQVRNTAADMLRSLAKHESLNPVVRQAVIARIEQSVSERTQDPAPHWRAGEQAAKLAGDLGVKPVAPQLVTLMNEHTRLEVRIAAVMGLRPLNVPATHQPMLYLITRLIDQIEQRAKQRDAAQQEEREDDVTRLSAANRGDSQQAAEAAQTLGVWRITEADGVLRRLIPKASPALPRARASAIWALGWIHEDKPDKALAKTLIQRLFDLNPLNPEANEVRRASVIAIARMDAKENVDAFKNRYRQDGLEIQAVARWGIHELTGEWMPELELAPAVRRDAFISPID